MKLESVIKNENWELFLNISGLSQLVIEEQVFYENTYTLNVNNVEGWSTNFDESLLDSETDQDIDMVTLYFRVSRGKERQITDILDKYKMVWVTEKLPHQSNLIFINVITQ